MTNKRSFLPVHYADGADGSKPSCLDLRHPRNPRSNGLFGPSGAVLSFALSAFILVVALVVPLRGAEASESMADRSLKQIVERQKELFASAQKQGEKLDEASFRNQVQLIVHDYELLLRDNPKFAAGYAAYGYLLGKVEMR